MSGRREFVTPVVVVSGCLEFEACRYNAQKIPFDFVRLLGDEARLVPICPEVEIGLGTPRDPIRLAGSPEAPRLVQPSTDRDVTEDMKSFSRDFLDRYDDVDGFILKNRSPSCGVSGVKIYHAPDASSVGGHGPGLFAAAVLEARPEAAVEDEGRLRNFRVREHFLTKLFALARLREVSSMRELVAFHTEYKLVLMAYNQTVMRELGRICANPDREPLEDVLTRYREGFGRAMRQAPRYTSVINVLEHAWGYVSKLLGERERAFYRSQLERYREEKIPVSGILAPLQAWALRFEVDYLLGQAFFHPFPESLYSVSDSGKGRLPR
ncbi:MAG: DUF523 and DUF1722 domain-containing protein [Gemmatimonadota bacterium]|nr:DUF523 and DUF1722 domain-containing protein [Gemmatimonadota bacterium]